MPNSKSDGAQVLIGAFGDEGGLASGPGKHIPGTIEAQCTMADMFGWSSMLRFVNFGTSIKPLVKKLPDFTEEDVAVILQTSELFGVTFSGWGSALGKQMRVDPDATYPDGFPAYLSAQQLLDTVAAPALEICHAFREAGHFHAVRVFTGNLPPGQDSARYVESAANLLRPSYSYFADNGFAIEIEIEANLVGDRAQTCVDFLKALDLPEKAGLVYDFGNIGSQGDSLTESWEIMRPHVVCIHAKHYIGPRPESHGPIDEHALTHYAPVTHGQEQDNVEPILRDVAKSLDDLSERATRIGLPGFRIILEPHVVGGGPFGGVSSPLGLFVADQELRLALIACGVPFATRGWPQVVERRDRINATKS